MEIVLSMLKNHFVNSLSGFPLVKTTFSILALNYIIENLVSHQSPRSSYNKIISKYFSMLMH
jgi:hypothetical protein